ncbi:MAG: glycosyltransferase [Pyrinomonadaceae bacterium]
MKVVRIIARLNVGGPARHVVWLTEAMQGNGYETTLIAGRVPEGEEDMAYFASERGVEPLYVQEMSRELSPKDAVSLFKVLRAIRREKPDIIHTHTAKAGTVGRTAAFIYRWFTWGSLIGRPRKVRVIHTFHGHVFHSYYGVLRTRVFVLIEKILARAATDKIVVITGQQFREICEGTGVGRREQFEVIPLGIDLADLAPNGGKREEFRREIAADGQTFVVGFVGRLTEIKNIPLLLESAKIVLDSEGVPAVRFVIIGDGHLRAALRSTAAELGIQASVNFVGNRDDLDRVYSGLDCVALTSLNEGTPLSLIEAMAAGKPVIATSVGGVVDLLGDAVEDLQGFTLCERGISVRSGDAAGFAKGLIYLAKNERLRLDLGAAGREFANQVYGKERLIEDIKSLYSRSFES